MPICRDRRDLRQSCGRIVPFWRGRAVDRGRDRARVHTQNRRRLHRRALRPHRITRRNPLRPRPPTRVALRTRTNLQARNPPQTITTLRRQNRSRRPLPRGLRIFVYALAGTMFDSKVGYICWIPKKMYLTNTDQSSRHRRVPKCKDSNGSGRGRVLVARFYLIDISVGAIRQFV